MYFNKQSIDLLTFYINSALDVNRSKYQDHFNNLKLDKKVKCLKTRFIFDLWCSLSIVEKDNVIDKTIPKDQWVGGYADYHDNHLKTLLNKVFTPIFNELNKGIK